MRSQIIFLILFTKIMSLPYYYKSKGLNNMLTFMQFSGDTKKFFLEVLKLNFSHLIFFFKFKIKFAHLMKTIFS